MHQASQQVEVRRLPIITGRWCFIDDSWKEKEPYSGQGLYSTLEGLMGARNIQASFSPLHSEIEALIWTMKCMKNLRQFQVTFATDCSQLVKMVSESEKRPAYKSYLEDIKILKTSFLSSEIIHVPRMKNLKADSLAYSTRK